MGKLTSTERREIRKVIEGDYHVIANEVKARANDMKEQAEKDIHEKYQTEQRVLDTEIKRMRTKVEKFQGEVTAWVEDMRTRYKGTRYNLFEISFNPEFQLKGKEDEVRQAQRIVDRDFRGASDQLFRLEQNAHREIAMTALEGQDARGLLETLTPSINELLPPRTTKQLLAGDDKS